MKKEESPETWEGELAESKKGEESRVDSPSPPCLHGMVQGRQRNLAHDEEDHLGALVSRQCAGKGACGEKTEERVGSGKAGSCRGVPPQPFSQTNYCEECQLTLPGSHPLTYYSRGYGEGLWHREGMLQWHWNRKTLSPYNHVWTSEFSPSISMCIPIVFSLSSFLPFVFLSLTSPPILWPPDVKSGLI